MTDDLERRLRELSPTQRELFLRLSEQQQPDLRATPSPASYPLSPAQERFWFLEHIAPGEPAHHLTGVLCLCGELDVAALQGALDRLVARHEALRTCFRAVGGVPAAHVQPTAHVTLRSEDLRALDDAQSTARRGLLLARCAAIDLANGPLLQCSLLRLAHDEWQLLWSVHHIVADGLSMLMLAKELISFYGALVGEPGAALPPAPLPYHDFAAWQAAREQRGALATGLAWYAEQLREPPTTRLPADHEADDRTTRGGRCQLELADEVRTALLAVGRSEGCTPYQTMLAGFTAALMRWTASSDVVLGTPVANRTHANLQAAVGLFVNSAVLRVRPDGNGSFRALLQHVRAVATATFAHSDVPFERLVQHLAPERHLDRNPLFQVMFNYVDFATLDVRAGGVHWRYEEAPAGTLFDFTLYVRRRERTIVLEAEFDCSLHEPATIEQRLCELHTLLQAAAFAPETAMCRLPLLPPAGLATLRTIERGPPLPPGPDDAWSLVRHCARARAGALALSAAERSCSYDELVAAAMQLGAALRTSGVQPGDLVACHLPRGAWLAIAPLAIWHAGGVVLPLDPEVPPAHRLAALDAARPPLVLVARDGPLPPGASRLLVVDDQHVASEPEPACALLPDSPAYVLFTSGSTGQPKGVVVAHGALAAFLRAMRATLPIGPDDVLLAITRPGFDIAWLELLLPLCTGARVHIAGPEAVRDGRALAAALAASRATFLQATPSTYRLLVESGFRGRADLHLLCGGEALPDDLAQSLRERCARLWNLYGPTETTIWSTVHEVDAGPVRIGRPLPGTVCHVLDGHGQRVPRGVHGELYIGGSGVALGYHELVDATAQRFVAGPDGDRVYRTGDRVRWGHDQQLQFFGRADDQIKLRGHRLELGAVEAWLAQHPAVVECAASTFETDSGPELAVHVVARDRGDETARTFGWRRVWQHAYTSGSCADPDFDTRGWLDSRTGEAIPAASMRRWRDGVAARIAQLAPQRVLEVGCGTGLLVAALAAEGRQWLATDATEAAVEAVAQLAERRGLVHVTTRQLAADALDELPPHAFDCVVLNSVVQYFPDLAYLLRVLDAARRRLAAGGTIWLGDVRLLPLHEAFVAWLELARAADDLPRAEFAARCERRLHDEPELLLAPDLFAELVFGGAFADAWLALEAAGDDTEMSRFRADVVLTIDTKFAPAQPLAEPVENARCAGPLRAFARRHDPSLVTVGELRRAAASAPGSARDPHELGDAVAGDRLLRRLAPALGARTAAPRCDAPLPAAADLAHAANTPQHQPDRSLLQRRLREHLAQHLPSAVLPTRFEWLHRLPRLPSGKLDRNSLRAPATRPSTCAHPVTDTERGLARLFTEVLGASDVGRDDDFFALGGHSLAAARLLARMRATFGVDLGLRRIFAEPTLQQLAAAIDGATPAATPPLQPRAPDAAERPGATMERLWFLQRLTPGSRAYLMTGVVDVVGVLDLHHLQRALDDVHARHEVLQLRLVERDGAARLVHDSRPPKIEACADRGALERRLAQIDGDGLEPLRVFCAPIDAHTHRVAFVLHHAFADGWSIGVLQHDLARAYAARSRGRAPDWSPLPLQYLDFARWQEQLAAQNERALAFWREELADAPATTALPLARPRPPRLREPGARLQVGLPEQLAADCARLAAGLGASRFHVLLAAFQVWIARLAGQSDVVVGTTTANRDDLALEPLVGCFVRTLPLRARLGDEPSFAQQVAAARETFLRASEHGQLPFQQIVDAVAAPRLLNRTPLFQVTFDWVTFDWLDLPEAPPSLAGIELRRVAHDPQTSKFELSLMVTHEQPFGGFVEYRTDLFDAATIEHWWRAFVVLLTAAVASPTTRVGDLPWVDEAMRTQLLQAGRGRERRWPSDDVLGALQAQIERTPSALAVRTPGLALTFAQLATRTAALAASLRERGAQPGDRIGLCLERSPELVLAVVGVLAAGCAYVPIDPDLPAARAAQMLAIAGVELCVCARAVAPPRELPGMRWCEVPTGDAALLPLPALAADDLAYVLFTSGSTGEPKGVPISHRALCNYAMWARETYAPDGGAPLHTPLGFDLSVTSIWPVLLAGGAVFLPEPARGIAPLTTSMAHGPFALVKLTPSHLRALLATQPPAAVQSMANGLVLGGEALDFELLAPLRQAGPGPRIWNEYGPTEATVGCAFRELSPHDGWQGPMPIGRAIANMRLYVLDGERRLVPPGVAGELYLAGHGLARGYLGREDWTREAFVDDPFVPGERMYRSGDRAVWSAAFDLLYLGRHDGQVKVRGHRIEPGEVRTALLREPGVHDAAVVLRRAPSGSEQLVAYVIGTADTELLRAGLAATLAPAAVPSHVVAVDGLPFDRHGKLDTAALPDPWRGPTRHAPAADDATTRALVRLASELLAVPDLSADDDFFRAGGDSILALQLVARAAGIGLALELPQVFRTPRLGALRRAARDLQAAADAPERGPLLPMQAWWQRQSLAHPQHYDQAVWLACREPIVFAELRRAVAALVERHPALRTRIAATGEQQVLAHGTASLHEHDLAAAPPAERERRLDELAHAPTGFAPEHGHVFAAHLVHIGRGEQLLYLRAHHVAVDAVSWHMLAGELEALLRDRSLPPAPTPPIVHAVWLAQARADGRFAADERHFAAAADGSTWPPGNEGDVAVAHHELCAAATATWLAAHDGPHHVSASELLVAAAAHAFATATGTSRVRVDLEGHGRAVEGAPDVGRTVGWFTTVYPVQFDALQASRPLRIRLAKETLRSVPNGGIAALPIQLPPAPLLCNYLGVADAGAGASTRFELLDRAPGLLRHSDNVRSHAFELRAVVRRQTLALELHAPAAANGACAASALVRAISDELQALLAACADEPAEPSLADHPLASLDREQLAALLASRPEVDAVYPLTPTQQGMVFFALKQPDSPAYREQLAAVVHGALDQDALAAAFADVAARHELLRGEVHWRGLPEPHWLIRSRVEVPFDSALLHVAPGESEAHALDRELARLRNLGFAFDRAPLLHVRIAGIAGERHALVVTYHHAVLDGWSMPLLLAELMQHYRRRRGEALRMPPRPAPFRDHVAFLRRQDTAAQRTFWRQRLAGFAEPLRLPGDRSPHEDGAREQPPPYAECELWLPARDTERVRSFANRSGLTMNTLVQGAWALLLSRWSGSDDVLFGMTVAGRPSELAGVEHRIGLFINTLPLRLCIDPDLAICDLLHGMQAEIAEVLAWQHTPLPISQAQCDVPRDPFESLVVFENYPLDAALRDLPDGLRLESTRAFERTSYPLTLVAIPGERLCLRLLHESDRWSPQLALQLLAGLASMLAQFADERARTAREIEWLPPAVRERAARLAQGPPAPEAELVLPALVARARASATATAIEHAGLTTSYGELVAMAERVARRLARVRTPGENPLVAVCCERSAETIAALLGIWWCGAAYLPLDPSWPPARRREVLASGKPFATIVDVGASVGWAEGHATIDLGTLYAAGADTRQAMPLPARATELAYAIATSGTTGAPKVVLVEHGSLANYTAAATAHFELQPHDRVLQFASLAFDTAAEEIWPTLCAGATLVLRTGEQAASSATFLAAAHAQRTTVWDLPTAFFHQLANALHGRVPASLRLCIVGGQAVHADAVAAFLRAAPAVRLCNTYGPSEATIVATWCDLHTEPGERRPPIGRPVPGTSAWVLDDKLQPLPIGVPGELCLGGRGLARGYLDAPSQAERRFVASGTGERLFRTGDLARHREDGQLEFLGRRDRQVKIGGQRVELDAVERVLSSHATVTEAVAATRGDEPSHELVAWVEAPAPGIDAQVLRAFVRERLPAACVPAHISVLEQMPRLVSGKVDRERLPALQPLPLPPDAVAASAPEAAVHEIFAELFPGRPVSLDDDFFALGGSSLLAVRLLDALHVRFGREVSIQALFDDPTPRGIAALLSGAATERSQVQPEQLRRDAEPGELQFSRAIAWRPPSAVLLTGATGFLGSWILRELLHTPTTDVFCLVRAADQQAARARLALALANTDAGARAIAEQRLHVVCGDVSEPDLGLGPREARELGARVTTVVHAAAAVDFLRPYAQLQRANVVGTREVLRLCAAHGLVLHHVSSVGVFTDPRAAQLAQIDEAIDLAGFDRPRGGYAQSKWVAERMVAAAGARGLPVTTHRPGRLVADSKIGRGNPTDFAAGLLRLCRDLGRVVPMAGSFDLTPVDWAAAALVHVMQRPDSVGKTFHLVHPRPTPARELLAMWRATGVPLVETTWPEFRSAAIALLQGSSDHPARTLLPFLLAAEALPGLAEPHFASHHTLAAMRTGGPLCPSIDAALVELWLADAVR